MNASVPNVLVAPLDWGLGHATRCIPVINELLNQHAEVFISASGNGKIILQDTFPELTFINIPGITVRYPERGSMALSMLLQAPAILNAINKENKLLKAVISNYHLTHIVSDNRYGMYAPGIKTAFITHQVRLKSSKGTKLMEPVLNSINKMFIERFNELWIPDQQTATKLSGDLSDASAITIPTKYPGILSRLQRTDIPNQKKYDVIALLSGPEPQRTILEKKLIPFLQASELTTLLIRGIPGKSTISDTGKLTIFDSISTRDLESLLHPETLLISRPGYSTIMDMAAIHHKHLLFIPTPGQTEQEYLAEHLFRSYGVRYILQHEKLPEFHSIESSNFGAQLTPEALETTINEFLTI